MTIQDIYEKINHSRYLFRQFQKTPKYKAVFVISVIILVGFLSFGLGRLYQIDASREPLKIYYADSKVPAESVEGETKKDYSASVSGAVYASKNSDKYHYEHCSGARTISEKNKITFASALEAEKAGYTLAGNCKIR